MIKRKHMLIGLLVFCFTAALLVGLTSSAPYDPWMDINDDGAINIVDIVALGIRFDEEGTPINKTELLLGLLERVPRAGNISVPAAAFTSGRTDMDWRNWGYRLQNQELSGTATFYAGVQLPHGATITNLTSYWWDNDGTSRVTLALWRYNSTHQQTMTVAQGDVSEDPGDGSSHATVIFRATVDNNKYTYFLLTYVPTPTANYYFKYAVIEYEYQ